MRIAYLTQYFPPEMGAPQVRIPEMMRPLIAQGHRVTILTGMPNYPTGRIFPGYRRLLMKTETLDGMRVVRVWLYPTLSVGFLRRLFSHMSFVVSSAFFGLFCLGRQDVILVESPPLFLALTARFLSLFGRGPYIAVVADLWPQVAIDTGMLRSGFGIRVARWLEAMLYRNGRAVFTQTPKQAEDIRTRFPGIPVHVTSGGVDTGKFGPPLRDPAVRDAYGVDGKIGVLFLGLHGFAQGLDVAVEAAALLRDRPNLRFVLVGDGVEKEKLQARARSLELPNLTFYDPIPRAQVPALLASMDIALVTLRRGVPLGTIPTKLYEAMASGLPTALAANGEAADLVRGEGVGFAVAPGDARGLADALARLASDPDGRAGMGQRARALAAARFDRTAIASRLDGLLHDIVGSGA
jgi:glycosyltransferase involved in cell wall biosynthesis